MHQIFLMLLLALLKFLILPAVVFAAPGPDDMVEGCRNCGPAIARPNLQIPQPAPVQPPDANVDEIEPKWWIHTHEGRRYLYLWQDSYRCLGYWDSLQQTYYPFVRGSQGAGWLGRPWEERKTQIPPMPLPSGYTQNVSVEASPDHAFTGVDRAKLSKVERFEINGTPASSAQVVQRLELTDDSCNWHVTVVSPDKRLREKVKHDFERHPALVALKGSIRLQIYDPTQREAALMLAPHRLDQDTRFAQTRFVALIQPPEGPDGKSPVYPVYSYDGPEAFAGAIRAVDPAYDPNRNRTPAEATEIPIYVWVFLAGIVLLVLVAVVAKGQQQPREE